MLNNFKHILWRIYQSILFHLCNNAQLYCGFSPWILCHDAALHFLPRACPVANSIVERWMPHCSRLWRQKAIETQVELLNSTQRFGVVDSLTILDYFNLRILICKKLLKRACLSCTNKWIGTHRKQPVAHTRSERVRCHWCEACPSRPFTQVSVLPVLLLEITGYSWLKKVKSLGNSRQRVQRSLRRTLWANATYATYATHATLRNSGPTAYALPIRCLCGPMLRTWFGSDSDHFESTSVHVYHVYLFTDGNIGTHHEAAQQSLHALGKVAHRQTNGLTTSQLHPSKQKKLLKTKHTVIICDNIASTGDPAFNFCNVPYLPGGSSLRMDKKRSIQRSSSRRG